MNESSRIWSCFSFSLSSIFDWSTLLGADVVDDLDPLPLLHVVDHDLPDHAIREAHVAHLGNQIVEEVRAPQPLEVGNDCPFGIVVVRRPDIRGRPAHALRQLDVVDVGVRLDHREAALLLETRHDLVQHRRGIGRRELGRRRHGQPADGCREVERRIGRSLRRWRRGAGAVCGGAGVCAAAGACPAAASGRAPGRRPRGPR